MVEVKDIYEYYASEEFVPVMPSNMGFRHFRVKLADKTWRKVPQKIRTSEQLQKWIIKLGGCDIYYGTSTWLNPHRISTKGDSGTYMVADNCLLSNDLVFDIDADSPICLEHLDLARKSANNIYEGMRAHSRFKLEYVAVTGFKGFRLSYKDLKKLPVNVFKRLDWLERDRKLFIEALLKQLKENVSNTKIYKTRTFFDENITINPMCVIRVLNTAHSSTGLISTKIPASNLRTPIKKILDNIPYIGKERPGIPTWEMTRDGDTKSPSPRLLPKLEDVAGLASSINYLGNTAFFITNKVLGVTKNFVPFFIYQKSQKYYKSELKKLQKKYRLGAVYIYREANSIIAVSLKSMQRRQLQKILNESTSRTKNDFKKHKRIFIPYHMVFETKLSWKFTGHLSYGHHLFVEPGKPLQHGTFCGWDKIELIKAKRQKMEKAKAEN